MLSVNRQSQFQAFSSGTMMSQCLETGATWKRSIILILASVVEGAILAPANALKNTATKNRISMSTRWVAMHALAPDEKGWNLSWIKALLCVGEHQRL